MGGQRCESRDRLTPERQPLAELCFPRREPCQGRGSAAPPPEGLPFGRSRRLGSPVPARGPSKWVEGLVVGIVA
jgi:hypothetical protein